MKLSLRAGRLAGIPVRVHLTFFLLPLWVGISQYSERGSWADAWAGVAFLLLVFGIVVLHEMAHVLTARRFGIATRDITLLPIGCVARLEHMPEDPKQELLVALAGPAVNFCFALLFFALAGIAAQFSQLTAIQIAGDFMIDLMWVNVGLLIFNLLPAFPMDGGRVLRALLALRTNHVRATRIAAGIGQTVAVGFAFIGLVSLLRGHLGPVSNPFLLLVGLFVWIGAKQESHLAQLKAEQSSCPEEAAPLSSAAPFAERPAQ